MRKTSRLGSEARLGWSLVAPALSVIALIAIFPLGWTFWESLHLHELRMPWLGKPFIGLANYAEIAKDPRFWAALGHTAFFTVVSISLELLIGLFLALAMNRVFRGADSCARRSWYRGRFQPSSPRCCGASSSSRRAVFSMRCSSMWEFS